MKKGEDYVFSREKRGFDIAVAAPLLPAGMLAAFVARLCFIPGEYSTVVRELRAGRGDEPFPIVKVRTLDPETGEPFPRPLASTFRNLGVDELVQAPQIIAGEMSMVGPRPLLPNDKLRMYEEASHDKEGSKLVDTYRSTVIFARPGLVSTTGIVKHEGRNPTVEERMEMDIKDYMDASLRHDAALLGTYLSTAIRGKLRDNPGARIGLDSGSEND